MSVPEGGKEVNLDNFPVKELWDRYLPPKNWPTYVVHVKDICPLKSHQTKWPPSVMTPTPPSKTPLANQIPTLLQKEPQWMV